MRKLADRNARYLKRKKAERLEKAQISAACQALADFRISYENRFFHINRDNTFATEGTLIALSKVISAFDSKKLEKIKINAELKEMFRQSFKALVDMLGELENMNVRKTFPELYSQNPDMMNCGYIQKNMSDFEEYVHKNEESILTKFRFLLPMVDGSDAFPDGILPSALSQQAVRPLLDQIGKMLTVAFPTAAQQVLERRRRRYVLSQKIPSKKSLPCDSSEDSLWENTLPKPPRFHAPALRFLNSPPRQRNTGLAPFHFQDLENLPALGDDTLLEARRPQP